LFVALLGLVTGCAGDDPGPRAGGQKPSMAASPTRSAVDETTVHGVSIATPIRAYVIRGRLHVAGRQLPGRFWRVTVRGEAWLATRVEPVAEEIRQLWGVGPEAHQLPVGVSGELSTNGRFLATRTDNECLNDSLDARSTTCVIGLIDTSGQEPPRRVVPGRTLELLGVSNQGAVLLTEGAALGWDEIYWDPRRGGDAIRTLGDPRSEEWAWQGWELDPNGAFGNDGLEFELPAIGQRWVGAMVDGQVRPRYRIPTKVDLGPEGTWYVRSGGWLDRPSSVPTTRTLQARKRSGGGRWLTLWSPRGWSFAPVDYERTHLAMWESPTAFLARVVDTRGGGDRLARCDIDLERCALIPPPRS
jgi:hypothetical protein